MHSGQQLVYRLEPLAQKLGVTSMTVRRWFAAGKFPKPVKLGANSIGFLASEVDQWLAARTAERDGAGKGGA